MELEKLHIGDFGSGPVSHRNAIAGRRIRIGCVEINLARATGRHKSDPPDHRLHLLCAVVQYIESQRLVIGTSRLNFFFKPGSGDEVDSHVVLKNLDIVLGMNRLNEGAFNLPTGEVVRVQNAAFGVPSFFSQIEFGTATAVKIGSKIDQLTNPCRTFAAGDAHKVFVAESATRFHRVLNMQFERIVLRHHRGDPALGIFGGRFLQRVLGDDADRPELANLERKRQPSHTRTNNNEISLNSHTWIISNYSFKINRLPVMRPEADSNGLILETMVISA